MNLIDRAARFFIDPGNSHFSPIKKKVAWAATVMAAITTLGIVQIASALWRKGRHVTEKNDTHHKIAKIFHKIFNGKKETEPSQQQSTTPTQQPTTDQNSPTPSNSSQTTSTSQTPPPEPSSQQFSSSDLQTFRATLLLAAKHGYNNQQPIKVQTDTALYRVWYNPQYNAINIQEQDYWEWGIQENKVGVIIDEEGRLVSLKIDNEDPKEANTVPEKYLERMHTCFAEALRITSRYDVSFPDSIQHPTIQITTVRRGLKEVSDHHLELFGRALDEGVKQKEDPKIKVSFMRDDLELDEGIDAGGLSRDYLDDLLEGVKKSKTIAFQKMERSNLALPRTTQPYTAGQPIPSLSAKENNQFFNLGKVITYCYHSKPIPGHWDKTYTTGRHFDDALFNAALCLTADEIDTPFEALTPEKKVEVGLKVGRALTEAIQASGEDMSPYLKRFDWLAKYDTLDPQALQEAAFTASYAGVLLPEFLTDETDPDSVDMSKINANREGFKKCLIDSIFEPTGAHGQLGVQIAPVLAIAQGMKSLCHTFGQYDAHQNATLWNTQFKNQNYIDFSAKVQGTVDRKTVAQGIVLDPSLQGSKKKEIEKKVKWLKEWITDTKNGATDEEVRKLLKFLTGSSSFPGKLTVIAQAETPYVPVPIAHTCSFQIEFAPEKSSYGSDNDKTKESFIKSLKQLALANPAAYSMD